MLTVSRGDTFVVDKYVNFIQVRISLSLS